MPQVPEDDELLAFLTTWIKNVTEKGIPSGDRCDARQSFELMKFLVTGEYPEWKPDYEAQLREVFILYRMMPEKLQAYVSPIIGAWKMNFLTDPEEYITADAPSPGIAAIV